MGAARGGQLREGGPERAARLRAMELVRQALRRVDLDDVDRDARGAAEIEGLLRLRIDRLARGGHGRGCVTADFSPRRSPPRLASPRPALPRSLAPSRC